MLPTISFGSSPPPPAALAPLVRHNHQRPCLPRALGTTARPGAGAVRRGGCSDCATPRSAGPGGGCDGGDTPCAPLVVLSEQEGVEMALLLTFHVLATAVAAGDVTLPAAAELPAGGCVGERVAHQSRAANPSSRGRAHPLVPSPSSSSPFSSFSSSTSLLSLLGSPYVGRRIARGAARAFNVIFPPDDVVAWLKSAMGAAADAASPAHAHASLVVRLLAAAGDGGSSRAEAYIRHHLDIFSRRETERRDEHREEEEEEGVVVKRRGATGGAPSPPSHSAELWSFAAELLVSRCFWQIEANRVAHHCSRVDSSLVLHSQRVPLFPGPAMRFSGSMLTSISLRHCGLRSLEGVQRCNLLEALQVDHNELEELPSAVFMFPSLRRIRADYNRLARLIVEPSSSPAPLHRQRGRQLGCSNALEELTVSHNRISHVAPDVALLHRLRSLDLSFNELTIFPEEILLGARSLRLLLLGGNRLLAERSRLRRKAEALGIPTFSVSDTFSASTSSESYTGDALHDAGGVRSSAGPPDRMRRRSITLRWCGRVVVCAFVLLLEARRLAHLKWIEALQDGKSVSLVVQ